MTPDSYVPITVSETRIASGAGQRGPDRSSSIGADGVPAPAGTPIALTFTLRVRWSSRSAKPWLTPRASSDLIIWKRQTGDGTLGPKGVGD